MDLRVYNAKFETCDRECLIAYQLEQLREVVASSWRNPFFRDRWKNAGIRPRPIRSLEEFSLTFPTIKKHDFVADQENCPPFGMRASVLLENDNPKPLYVYNTSGTSGQGVELHIQTHTEAAAVRELYRYMYCWAGLRPADHVFLAYPISLLSGGQMEMAAFQAYPCTVFPVGSYDVMQKLALLERFQPRVISGTNSYLLHMAAASGSSPPCSSVDLVFCSGESCAFALYEKLENLWAANVVNLYGASQIRADPMFTCERYIGTRSQPGLLHNIDPFFLLEVIDPSTGYHVGDGEMGEIVVTSLVHKEIPLIRCATGDKAVYHESKFCSCGRPFGGVEIGTISRMDGMTQVKGINVWPEAVQDVLFGIPEIDEYQVVLKRGVDEADVAIARLQLKNEHLSIVDIEAFRNWVIQLLRERIGVRFEIEFVAEKELRKEQYKTQRWFDKRP